MLRLKNLEKNNGLVACDLYIEGNNEPQRFIVDVGKQQIIRSSAPDGYANCDNYFAHAKWKLIELAEKEPLPKECTIMWY